MRKTGILIGQTTNRKPMQGCAKKIKNYKKKGLPIKIFCGETIDFGLQARDNDY